MIKKPPFAQILTIHPQLTVMPRQPRSFARTQVICSMARDVEEVVWVEVVVSETLLLSALMTRLRSVLIWRQEHRILRVVDDCCGGQRGSRRYTS